MGECFGDRNSLTIVWLTADSMIICLKVLLEPMKDFMVSLEVWCSPDPPVLTRLNLKVLFDCRRFVVLDNTTLVKRDGDASSLAK